MDKCKRDTLIDFFNDKNNHPYSREELLAIHNVFVHMSDLSKWLSKLTNDNFLSKKRVKINGYVKVFYYRRVK